MIVSDAAKASQVFDALTELTTLSVLPPELQALCDEVMQTVAAPAFPGALVPTLDSAGAMYVNVAAAKVSDWRHLKPILLSFAGPTMTGFEGIPGPLLTGDAAGQIMMGTGPAVTAVVPLPGNAKLRIQALRALVRARATLERAPDLQRTAPVPTSWLLARFQDHLNVGHRDAAATLLERLRRELRLDALNLKFLEVQFYATFGDWAAILGIPEFANLCRARRTSAVTALLLEAIYQVHLAAAFEAKDLVALRNQYAGQVRGLTHSMLILPAPGALTNGGARIYALEALLSPGQSELIAFLSKRDDLGWLSSHFAQHDALPEVAKSESPLDDVRQKLLEVDAVADNDRVVAVLTALAGLTADERTRLSSANPFAPIIAEIEAFKEDDLPTSWPVWLERVADPGFTAALEVASRGAVEWPIDMASGDPTAVQALVAALDRAQASELAAERTSQALPYLVSWLKRDKLFPRPAFAPVYGSLLTLFALGNARSDQIYDSSQILISALLAVGLDQKGYAALTADINEIAGDGFGVNTVYWLLEMVEVLMRAPTPDASVREAFLHGVLARIAPLFARLTSLQRLAVELLCSELGWPLETLGANVAAPEVDGLAARLEGLRIAIYSLTETASRQAKVALEALNPKVIVDTNADHGGTSQLRALSENVDLFVITWLSAKHAATDFIRAHRGDRPLIYAQGKGFSSILRIIEEHLLGLPSANFEK